MAQFGEPLSITAINEAIPMLLNLWRRYEELTCQERNFSTLENNQFS